MLPERSIREYLLWAKAQVHDSSWGYEFQPCEIVSVRLDEYIDGCYRVELEAIVTYKGKDYRYVLYGVCDTEDEAKALVRALQKGRWE